MSNCHYKKHSYSMTNCRIYTDKSMKIQHVVKIFVLSDCILARQIRSFTKKQEIRCGSPAFRI